jgi:hypothetical protein
MATSCQVVTIPQASFHTLPQLPPLHSSHALNALTPDAINAALTKEAALSNAIAALGM